ncbi:GntR family transcriptional regulator [Sporolactobacillus sp. CPB3-1]|uniref:GntR family transcriptional regulator n=1 Tax=Sporolactobacillus mangiferae TaxID=2940498 RepID=A0ABT0MC55_9BACL|nr:GntR family transcriptional regulator [Sporolactobacillus mangiferae]MCL1632158.1 GntR family transcriptional regulator [Sporolactobacillus mangiferae]
MSMSDTFHLKIAEFLITQINNGTYACGDRLPSENELCAQFQTNHHVVRLAISRLINMGWVATYQGKGSFVKSRPEAFPYSLSAKTGFSSNLKGRPLAHRGQLMQWEKRHPMPHEARYLDLEMHEYVYDLRIKRFINEQPMSLSTTVIRAHDVPDLPDFLADFQSLYKILSEHYQIRPIRTKSIVQAIMPTLKDTDLLHLPENVPLVKIESFARHPSGHPFEYNVSKIRSDMCRYVIDF